ncbi:MAG: hypothetical protein J0L84_01650 [Verrucomicrobia bacterium]|nr:hypothetical protein [Verrucomicrobiota bacterium]
MRPRLAGLMIGLWIPMAGLGAETFTVNDELQVRFLGVTAGTNHIMPGQRLRQLHGRAPAWLKDILGWVSPDSATPLVSRTTEESALNLWFWDASPSNRSGLRSPYVPQRVMMRLLAEDGLPWGQDAFPQRAGWPWVFEATIYPRRQRTILFEFVSFDPPTPAAPFSPFRRIGTLRVRNPSPFAGPFWKPQPLPAHRTTNGLNLSANDVRVDRTRGHAGRPGLQLRTVVELSGDFVNAEVRQRIRRVRLSDPTGNRIQLIPFPGTNATTDGGSVRFWSGDTLFDDDPAWRLSVDLAPKPEEGRSEVLRVARVPDSSPAQTSPWDESSPLPIPSPMPASPAPQSSALFPGLSVEDVRVWHHSEAPDHSMQVNMTVIGASSDVMIRVASVEDAAGLLWLPMGRQDLFLWPLELGQVGLHSFMELHPSQGQTHATPPFQIAVEVLLPHRVDFLVPAHVPRLASDGSSNRIPSSGNGTP